MTIFKTKTWTSPHIISSSLKFSFINYLFIPQQHENLKTRSSAVNTIVRLIFNVRANFKKVLQFQSSLTHFFETKIEKLKNMCSRGKTIFRFSNNCSSFRAKLYNFHFGQLFVRVSPPLHSKSGLPPLKFLGILQRKKHTYLVVICSLAKKLILQFQNRKNREEKWKVADIFWSKWTFLKLLEFSSFFWIK